MKYIKSRERFFISVVYVLVAINFLSVICLILVPSASLKLLFIALFLINLFIILFMINPKKSKNVIGVFFTSLFLYFLLGTGFRLIRDLFPQPKVNEQIVGFVQYFNYPYYFDTFLFILIIFIPFISYFLTKKFIK